MRPLLSLLIGVAVLIGGCARSETSDSTPPEEATKPAPTATSPASSSVADDSAEGCSQASLSRVVRTSREAVTQCYRAAAQKDPNLRGRLAVSLGIQPGGRLAHRGIESSDFPVEVNRCILQALEGLEFSSAIDVPCVVVYPFVFSASTRKTP